jgi:2-methylisocitrate lyase-like PEP mutase family enzyme
MSSKRWKRPSTCSATDGTQGDILDLMQTREELYELLDYQAFEERDRAHSEIPRTKEPKNQAPEEG